jgi:hypothetical protein
LINSLSSLFTAARLRGRAFSRSYGTNLPSSFIRVVSNALGYSPRPPVSVSGTDSCCLKLRGFSWKRGITYFAGEPARHHLSELISRICLRDLPTGLNCHPTDSYANLLRHPIAATASAGILTCFPSTTPFGLALGSDSPSADYRCAGTLGLTANGFFTRIVVTHVSIRTSDTSSRPYDPPSQAYRTLLYHAYCYASAASVYRLSPVTSSARADSTSELLRFL